MIKSSIKPGKYTLAFVIGIIGAVYLMFGMRKSIEEAMLFGCGSYLSLENFVLISSVLSLPPMLLLLYLFADVLSYDFSTVCVYVFTRTKRRGTWLFLKTGDLFIQTVLYWIILIACYVAAGWLSGQQITRFTWRFAGEILALQALTGFLLLLICNVLSLKMKLHYAMITVFIVHLASLFICVPLYQSGLQSWIRFIPSANCVYGWHILPAAGREWLSDYAQSAVPGLSVAFSIAYLSALILVIFIAGMWLLSAMDLLNLEDT